MAEQQLMEALEAKSRERIAAIESEADDAIRAIQADVDSMIADIRARLETEAEAEFEAFRNDERIRRDNEQRIRRREVRRRFVDSVLEEVEREVARLRERPDYGDIWQGLYREALARYDREQSAPPKVGVHPADRTLALRAGISDASLVTDAAVSAGVVLTDPSGRFRVVNTPASRFRKGREAFVKEIVDAFRSASGQ